MPPAAVLPLRLLAAVLVSSAWAGTPDDALPQPFSFSFYPDPNVDFSFRAAGASKVLTGRTLTDCMASLTFKASDVLGDVAIVNTNLGQGCYTSTTYCNSNYTVRPGFLSGGSLNFTAYQISPPAVKATSFAASGQMLYLRPPGAGSFTVYQVSGTTLLPVATLVVPSNVTTVTYMRTGQALQSLQAAIVFVLLPSSQVLPQPTRRVISATAATECQGTFPPLAVVGDLAVVTTKYSGSCWTNGNYNNDLYLVERGQLIGTAGAETFTAYRVSPPQKLASQWVASGAQLYFRPVQNTSLVVYTWTGIDFVAQPAVSTVGQAFNAMPVRVENLKAPTIYVFQDKAVRVSTWPLVAPGVEAAWLSGSTVHSLTVRRFATSGTPSVPARDWPWAPGQSSSNYGDLKKFFPVQRADGLEGVVWQDQVSHSISMTWFASDLLSASTTLLVLGRDWLLCATSNGQDQIVLLLANETRPAMKTGTTNATLVRLSSTTGVELARQPLPTGKAAPGLNMYFYSGSGASMTWNTAKGWLGVVLARTMTQSSDGLNHQGAIALVVDASSLLLLKNFGQTSGHSFANSLMLDSTGAFLGMDLGDNYPRGVNVWQFTNSSITSRVVYRFKTLHGTSPTSPAGVTYPVYTNISTPNKTFYCWSNDNNVYTELGHPGIVEVSDGLLVFFAGERPPLDNSQTGSVMNVPRNAGFVKVPKALSSTSVLSAGPNETGGFYSFGGGWTNQLNQGISFLTSYSSADLSVSRLKTVRLAPGKLLLYWELWSATAYGRSQLMVVDDAGQVVLPVLDLGFALRLPIADDPRVLGNRTVFYTGTPEGSLARYELCVQDGCPVRTPVALQAVAAGPASKGSELAAQGAATVAPATPPLQASVAGRAAAGASLALVFAAAASVVIPLKV